MPNGCCMRNSWGEEYPGQFEELGGSHDLDCWLYNPDGSPKDAKTPQRPRQNVNFDEPVAPRHSPEFAPLPPGFHSTYVKHAPAPNYPPSKRERIDGPNWCLWREDTRMFFKFSRKPPESTLQKIRPHMRWDGVHYVWHAEFTQTRWEVMHALAMVDTHVVAMQPTGSVRMPRRTSSDRYNRTKFTDSEAYGERGDDYDDDLFNFGD